jgi:hypothetical protein
LEAARRDKRTVSHGNWSGPYAPSSQLPAEAVFLLRGVHMAQYPSIHLLIDPSQDDYLIIAQANMQMMIHRMEEIERREVIKQMAMSQNKLSKAKELFTVEVI